MNIASIQTVEIPRDYTIRGLETSSLRLHGELKEIQEVVETSGFHGTLKEKVTKWTERFPKYLSESFHEALQKIEQEVQRSKFHDDMRAQITTWKEEFRKAILQESRVYGFRAVKKETVDAWVEELSNVLFEIDQEAHRLGYRGVHDEKVSYYKEVFHGTLRGIEQELQQKYEKADYHDELTEEIGLWAKNFTIALQESPDHERISKIFITAMQELLRDRVTLAPLDEEVLLGSDGHTYGKESLDVSSRLLPRRYKDRSPSHPEDRTPLETEPHVVAQHMVRWLKNHDALFYSQELKDDFTKLLAKEKKEDEAKRLHDIMERQKELADLENKERMNARKELEQFVDDRLHDVDVVLAGKIKDLHIEEPFHEGKKMLQDMADKDEEDVKRLQKMMAHAVKPLKDVQEAIDRVRDDDKKMFDGLQATLKAEILGKFDQLAKKVDDFQKTTLDSIKALKDQKQASIEEVSRRVKAMKEGVREIRQENEILQEKIRRVKEGIEDVHRRETRLQQAIHETQEAVNEMKDKSLDGLLNSIGIVAGCALATVALGNGFFFYHQGGASGLGYAGSL